MADLPSSIRVRCLHSREMVRAELAAMLEPQPAVTPAALARLWLADSPFVLGGEITGRQLQEAQAIVGHPWDIRRIEAEVATAIRALETIVPGASSRRLSEEGGDAFGPEWLADLYAAVARAAPGIAWREFLAMPMAAAAHLACAAHRAAGGRTERPMDWQAALEEIASPG